jgi:hypothetical protein
MIKMGNFSEEEEQEPSFFDTREEISSVSDWSSDCGDCSPSVFNSFSYDDWTRNPESVQDRRRRFLKWMGLSLDRNDGFEEKFGDDFKNEIQWVGVDRTEDNSGAVLRTSSIEDDFCQLSLLCLPSQMKFGDNHLKMVRWMGILCIELKIWMMELSFWWMNWMGMECLVDCMKWDPINLLVLKNFGEHSAHLLFLNDFLRNMLMMEGIW